MFAKMKSMYKCKSVFVAITLLVGLGFGISNMSFLFIHNFAMYVVPSIMFVIIIYYEFYSVAHRLSI